MQCQLFSQMRIFPAFLVCCFRRCHVIDRQVLARCRRLEAQSVEGTTRYSSRATLSLPYCQTPRKALSFRFQRGCPSSLEGSLFLLVSRRVARPSVSGRVGHLSISGRVISPLIPRRVISLSVSGRVVSPSTSGRVVILLNGLLPFQEGLSVL